MGIHAHIVARVTPGSTKPMTALERLVLIFLQSSERNSRLISVIPSPTF